MSAFDWVAARSACTLDKEFERPSDDVQRDLKRHNSLNPGLAQCQTFDVCEDGGFYVERTGIHRIVFTKERERIRIDKWEHMGEYTPLMALKVRMGDDGKCVLIDEDGNVLKSWQVRRKALEETLFGSK